MKQIMIKQRNGELLSSIRMAEFERPPMLEEISVVIPTLGRPILEACLVEIISGSRWPRALILVHQGDQPAIKDWVELLNDVGIETIYIRSAERGKPAAINLAFAHTHTKFVCIIDDDCFVDPEWLQNMNVHLQTHPDWIVTGRVEPAGNETVAIVQSRKSSVQFRPKLKFDSFSGGNMGAAMDVIRCVGPFDEDPLLRNAAEDAEWGYRALRKGIPIAYAPEVVVSHFGWRDGKDKSDRFKAYAYGHGSFYGKYLRQGDWFVLARAIGHFVRALRRWVRGRLNGDGELALLGKAYCLNLLPGILAGMRSKTRQRMLK
jgi:GT2 family glycosyltransferase